MNRLTALALLCAAPLCALAGQAPPPGVLTLFSCTLNDGQTYDNVWATLEEVRDRVDNPEEGFSLFLWLPYRGNFEHDYVWGITASDVASMARGSTNWATSGNAGAMNPKFQALNENCDSVILTSEQMHAGQIGQTGDRTPDAVTETFACRLNPGADFGDLMETAAFWQQQMAALNHPALNTYEAFLMSVFRGGTGESDFGWIGSYPNLETWGEAEKAWNESKQGQAANERWGAISRCASALWTGYWIVPPGA